MLRASLKKLPLCILFFTVSASVFSADKSIVTMNSDTDIPAEIKAIMNKPMYKNSIWSLKDFMLQGHTNMKS